MKNSWIVFFGKTIEPTERIADGIPPVILYIILSIIFLVVLPQFFINDTLKKACTFTTNILSYAFILLIAITIFFPALKISYVATFFFLALMILLTIICQKGLALIYSKLLEINVNKNEEKYPFLQQKFLTFLFIIIAIFSFIQHSETLIFIDLLAALIYFFINKFFSYKSKYSFEKLNLFNFFLYLCTLEILPYFVAIVLGYNFVETLDF